MPTSADHTTGPVSSACVASFQILCSCANNCTGILRVHPAGGDWEHRSEFTWCCTMRTLGIVIELWGVRESPPLSYARAIKKYALDNKYAVVAYERHGDWIVWDVITGRRTVTRNSV